MKALTITLISIILSISISFAQDPEMTKKDSIKNSRNEIKNIKKEQNTLADQKALARYDSIANSKSWVLEAHTLYDRYNNSFPVNSALNFISLSDSLLTIQLSASNTYMDYNGVGGITLEGKLMHYKIKTNKYIYILCTALTTVVGNSDIYISIYSNGRASAKFSDTWGDRYSLDGYLIPYSQSRIFKGTKSY